MSISSSNNDLLVETNPHHNVGTSLAGTYGCVDSRDGFRYCMLVIYYKAANETIVKHAETRSRSPRTSMGPRTISVTLLDSSGP